MHHEDLNDSYEAYRAEPGEQTLAALHKAMVYVARGLVYQKLHHDDANLACDAASDALMALDKFRRDSAFSTWFYKIALNKALMTVREASFQSELATPSEELDAMSSPSDSTNEQALLIEKAKGFLSASEIELLELRLTGFSTREIAEKLKLSQATVARSVTRLQERLARIFEERTHGETG